MKKLFMPLSFLLSVVAAATCGATNNFVSGSTGSLGALNPSSNTTITLPADGVLNYTTINIPTGVTVTFTSNALNTPVHMLATGNVTITGTINVNGKTGTATAPGAGGAGGYAGGYSATPYTVTGGCGLGPGGGNGSGQTTTPVTGIHGSYATAGSNNTAGSVYGNINILPLIGGSGGGGGWNCCNTVGSNNGGGGGGAIMIASSDTITVNGSILAKAGAGATNYAGSGSGGAIKLMAVNITGTGVLDASSGGNGGTGRIRLESYNLSYYGSTVSPAFTYGIPGSIFGSAPPTIAITSIGGINAPSASTGNYTTADIALPNTTVNPVPVAIAATNIPVGTSISVRVVPQTWKTNTLATDLPAVTTTLTGTDASSSGTVNVTIPATCTTVGTACTSVILLQVAPFTVTAFNFQGEVINAIRVASASDGTSQVFYITTTGKEIRVS